LFSNSIPPFTAAATLRVLDVLDADTQLRTRLWDNATYFRTALRSAGFDLGRSEHPIIPVMLGDARLATEFAQRLLARGVYVIGFSFPVVPHGKARIRTQMSAAHTQAQLDLAITAFTDVGRELGVV
jgi:glycine C-acetyltransferase